VTFTNDEKEYTVSREITRGHGSSAEVRDGGTLVEGNNSQRVTERVEEMLKIDYDLFSRAVYSEQNNIDYFLEIPKSQRKQKIDELLSIDRFEAARKSLTTVVSRLRDRAAEKEKMAAPPDAEQIPILEKEIAELDRKKSEAKSSHSALTASKSKLESEYSAISSEKKRYEDASRSLDASRGRLSALKERLASYGLVQETEAAVRAKIESLKTEKAEIRSQADELARLEREHASILSAIKSSEERLADVRSRKLDEEAPSRRDQLAARIDSLTSEIESSHAERKAKAAALAELDENSKKLKGDACPVCDAQLTGEKKAELLRRKADERLRITREMEADRKSTRLNSSHNSESRMPSSA
jgi:DNA repair exonuclease SbcCD ATPase subunit